MKFHIVFSIALVILATTTSTQGLLKSAIKKKLPLVISAVSGLKSSLRPSRNSLSSAGSFSTLSGSLELGSPSSGSISTFSEQQPIETLSAAIPPTVTLYQYPTEHQVIYRSIRPVVRRTIYVQEQPTYSNRALVDGLASLIPSPITGAIGSIKSALGGIVGLPARASLSISASPAVQENSVPAQRQVYYVQ